MFCSLNFKPMFFLRCLVDVCVYSKTMFSWRCKYLVRNFIFMHIIIDFRNYHIFACRTSTLTFFGCCSTFRNFDEIRRQFDTQKCDGGGGAAAARLNVICVVWVTKRKWMFGIFSYLKFIEIFLFEFINEKLTRKSS